MKKAELLRKLPSILAVSVLILGSLVTSYAKTPIDSGLAGSIIQLVLAMIIMTVGLFFLVYSIKK